jgi:STE24 endopeptidase
VNEDKATRYHRLRRRASTLSLVAGTLTLGLLALTGLSVDLRAALQRLADGVFDTPLLQVVALVVCYTASLVLLLDLATFPFNLFREWTLERRYGLERVAFSDWLRTHIKGGVIGFAIALGAAAVLLLATLLSERWWWLLAAIGIWGGQLLLTTVAPLLLLPLFAHMTPLPRQQRAALIDRLNRLATRAGAHTTLRVYQWGGGEATRRADAALVGFGRTRRVLLSESLLASCSDEEIEVVVAHELAHHVHGDLWKHALGRCGVLIAAFWAADGVLTQFAMGLAIRGGGFPLGGPGDPASWPLMLLVIGGAFMVTSPLMLAWSRHDERRADRYALTLTGNAEALLSVLRRLSALNLAEERYSRAAELFFASHPSFPERIAAIKAWADRQSPQQPQQPQQLQQLQQPQESQQSQQLQQPQQPQQLQQSQQPKQPGVRV